MKISRVHRLNSLLKEVISDVIRQEVRHPFVHTLMTVMRVEITKDLHYATVYISVIGTTQEKEETVKALQSAAGFIAVQSSKQVTMRYFPSLTFKIDNSVDHQMRVHTVLNEIEAERNARNR